MTLITLNVITLDNLMQMSTLLRSKKKKALNTYFFKVYSVFEKLQPKQKPGTQFW